MFDKGLTIISSY